MAKEKFLTVMVPIKDGDCESGVYNSIAALSEQYPPSESNLNKIYKLSDGTYVRSKKTVSPNLSPTYNYVAVTDREFPILGGTPLEIHDFTYDATRMGQAPTISAQGVMWFAEKDSSGDDITLEEYWQKECHVVFNGDNFYLKSMPTTSKSNDDARYKYDIEFVSERVILENVFIYDVVQPFITEKPISESDTFSFFGDINELAKRINASMIRSGLASLVRKYVNYPNSQSAIVPYLNYEQWNQINIDPTALIGAVFANDKEEEAFVSQIYEALDGNYNDYITQYIYENYNGDFTMNGYRCVVGIDKKGEVASSEEKFVSFEKNTIHEALQAFNDIFGLEYYITKETDISGDYTGNTLVVVGDCEHDFADVDPSTGDYVRDSDGIPMSSNPFEYGSTRELLSKEKRNTTEKIITRITGVGSSDNIPWHYPNPNPDGWISPVYKVSGQEQNGVVISYQSSEGSTAAENNLYEKYLKNRIGVAIKRGYIEAIKTNENFPLYNDNPSTLTTINVACMFDTTNVPYGNITFEMNVGSGSSLGKFSAGLTFFNFLAWQSEGAYDSDETYQDPTDFQTMMIHRDGGDSFELVGQGTHILGLSFNIGMPYPLSRKYDYEGFHYPYVVVPLSQTGFFAIVPENFYEVDNLQPFVDWQVVGQTMIVVYYAGYSVDGTKATKVLPLDRVKGKQYKDLGTDTIYVCTNDDEPRYILPGANYIAFDANPTMSHQEWVDTFVDFKLKIYSNDGWYISSKKILLEDYGITGISYPQAGYQPSIRDSIEFKRLKWLTPQSTLMPEVYIKTDGERRFYNAHNYYPLQNGEADTAIGEVQDLLNVKNPLYKENETDSDDKHYEFENEYDPKFPHEAIETMDDKKPSIVGQTSIVDGVELRIDVVEMFEYDETDNNEVWENSDDGGISADYKHPYFFAKLRPLGFNLFDLALQDDMVISMTTGNCGACNFKIGVDENTLKNPVQIWEYDVYGGPTYEEKGTRLYSSGELRRYIKPRALYYDTDGTQEGYTPLNFHYEDEINNSFPLQVFYTNTYSADDYIDGFVGSLKQDGKSHFEGDVITSGKFIQSQQDTSENYVWVALMKDTDTYGTIMPSAIPNYNNPLLNQYIEPKGIAYKNRRTGEETTLTEDEADKFVFINIRMPQVYLRRAERELSKALIKQMFKKNGQTFDFSIKFSRIFIEENIEVDEDLNENSVVYVGFNRSTFRQYVKHYTYTMKRDEPLPEISIDILNTLSVTRNASQQQKKNQSDNNQWAVSYFSDLANQIQQKSAKHNIGKNNNVVIYGDIIYKGTSTSISNLGIESRATQERIDKMQKDLDTDVYTNLKWIEL